MELLLLVCIVLVFALCLWCNYDWYKHCLSMNAYWFEKMTKLEGSVGKVLDRMQKEIDELEAKLDDDGR